MVDIKRGIVLDSAEYEVTPGGFHMVNAGVSSEKLRFYLLYFDLIERPSNNFFTVGLSQDEEFLLSCGVFSNTQVMFQNTRDLTQCMIDTHQSAYNHKRKTPGQFWSLGRSGAVFPDASDGVESIELIEMSLYQALPAPTEDVPLSEILEFKEKRRDELLALRAHLDEIYESVSTSGDIPRANSAALFRLSSSIKDLQKVVDPSFSSRLLSGLKVQIDVQQIAIFGLAGVGAASGLGLPVAIGAAIGAAASAVKFEIGHGKKTAGTPESLRDFSYLASVDREFKS